MQVELIDAREAVIGALNGVQLKGGESRIAARYVANQLDLAARLGKDESDHILANHSEESDVSGLINLRVLDRIMNEQVAGVFQLSDSPNPKPMDQMLLVYGVVEYVDGNAIERTEQGFDEMLNALQGSSNAIKPSETSISPRNSISASRNGQYSSYVVVVRDPDGSIDSHMVQTTQEYSPKISVNFGEVPIKHPSRHLALRYIAATLTQMPTTTMFVDGEQVDVRFDVHDAFESYGITDNLRVNLNARTQQPFLKGNYSAVELGKASTKDINALGLIVQNG